MRLEIRTCVREQREARRVRLGNAVERERRDRSDDLVGRRTGDALPGHPLAQLHFDLLHPPLRPLETERTPQLFRLSP